MILLNKRPWKKRLLQNAWIVATFWLLASFRLGNDTPRIFLIGDSTMSVKSPDNAPETGWGMAFAEYIDQGRAQVQNHAMNGRSTKSFRTEGRWAKVVEQLKPNDWVLIQFAHNDQKIKDSTRYAAPQTDYRKNLIRYVEETRQKGANPILITPVERRKFDEKGQFVDQHGEYPAVVKAVARELKVPLIDLQTKSNQAILQHGVEGSKALFMHFTGGFYPKSPNGKIDDTHFSKYGAEVMASLVAEEIQAQKLPIGQFFKPFGTTDKYVYELPHVLQPVFRKDTFNVLKYGAKSDGQSLNNQAINRAIDACNQAGGGTVLIPKGFWLTGPIVLKSNVNLHLMEGALLQFSSNRNDYPLVETNWEGQDAIRCQAPISALKAQNIAITGKGVVDGAGQVWRQVKKEKLTESQWKKLIASGGVVDPNGNAWYPSEQSMKGNKTAKVGLIKAGYTLQNSQEWRDYLRPNLVVLNGCKQVLLEGVTFQNSPAWCLHPLLTDHITLRNVTVRNPWFAQNGDGLDLESCRYGLIENCSFDVGDDGICIKSGRDEEGRKRGVPTENVIVQNCTVFHGHGGFVIGSEMSGGVKNLFVTNCNFLGTDVGLRFKTARGRGGVVENIYVSDINMTNIPGEAILFDMYYMAKDPVPQAGAKNELPEMKAEPLNEGTPQFKNFYIRNVVCQGAETGILIRGLPEMSIKNIQIENAVLESNKGLVCIEAENIQLKNVTLRTRDKLPMQVQNSKNVTLDNIHYDVANTDVVLKLSGNRTQNVRLLNTDTSKARKDVELSAEVSPKVLSKK
ncbi:glycosyl hydrolase family 28 protein [Tellurirhabdus bombi]|uniref:glycosyl hydrolase family 28 protein n=1 Tax=Tellurirhabdus bombi TaxID=2907205 RepID=UPI001F2F0445|nr:glycosyl hydrolase family 28 protein [Tellurirhabdus bombi]